MIRDRFVALTLVAGLAACAQDNTPSQPTAPVQPQRVVLQDSPENVCPLLRFTIAGTPAAQENIGAATSALRQALIERGYELVVVDELVDRFQQRLIKQPSGYGLDDPRQFNQTSTSEVAISVRESIRDAALLSLEDVDAAEITPCTWILTGEIAAATPGIDVQTGRMSTAVIANLDIVDTFNRRSVGSAYNYGTVQGSPNTLRPRALTYGLESIADTVTDQIDVRRNFYLIKVPSRFSSRELLPFRQGLERHGFEVRNVVQDKIDTRFIGSVTEMEVALDQALTASGALQNADYEIRGKLVEVKI